MFFLVSMLLPLCGCVNHQEHRIINISEISGLVSVVEENTEYEAYRGMHLQEGHTMITSGGSFARMVLDDDKYMKMEEGSRVQVETLANGRTEIHLERGAITNEIVKPLYEGQSFIIHTPNAALAVRGTYFSVELSTAENGDLLTKVSTYGGSVVSQRKLPNGEKVEEAVLIDGGYRATISMDTEDTIYLEEVIDEELEYLIPIEMEDISDEELVDLYFAALNGHELFVPTETLVTNIESRNIDVDTYTSAYEQAESLGLTGKGTAPDDNFPVNEEVEVAEGVSGHNAPSDGAMKDSFTFKPLKEETEENEEELIVLEPLVEEETDSETETFPELNPLVGRETTEANRNDAENTIEEILPEEERENVTQIPSGSVGGGSNDNSFESGAGDGNSDNNYGESSGNVGGGGSSDENTGNVGGGGSSDENAGNGESSDGSSDGNIGTDDTGSSDGSAGEDDDDSDGSEDENAGEEGGNTGGNEGENGGGFDGDDGDGSEGGSGDDSTNTPEPCNHVKEIERTDSTCTQPGEEIERCSICGEVLKRTETPATGHAEETVRTEPSCTQDGEEIVRCVICREVLETRVLTATGHTEETETTEATCTQPGEEIVRCNVCQEVLETRVLTATGHTEEMTSTASCLSSGTKTTSCTVCNTVISTEEDPRLPHQEGSTCSACGSIKIADTANFTDLFFQQYVSAKEIDKDEDGYLSTQEGEAVTAIYLGGSYSHMMVLDGTEYFPNAEIVELANLPSLAQADISGLTKVNNLKINNCQSLQTLDISQNTMLETLHVSNALTGLDMTHNTALKTVTLYGSVLENVSFLTLVDLEILEISDYDNKMSALDLSNNVKLKNINIQGGGSGIQSIKLGDTDKKLNELTIFYANNIAATAYDFSNCPKLRNLTLFRITANSFNVSGCDELMQAFLTACTFAQDLDMSGKSSLGVLDIGGTTIASTNGTLNLNGCNGLTSLSIGKKTLQDASGITEKVPSMKYIYIQNCTSLPSVNLGNVTGLEKVYTKGTTATISGIDSSKIDSN